MFCIFSTNTTLAYLLLQHFRFTLATRFHLLYSAGRVGSGGDPPEISFLALSAKMGSSVGVKTHQSKMSPFGLILLCSSILRTGFFAPKFVINKFYSVKGREAT